MDPTEALKKIRAILANGVDGCQVCGDAGRELADLVEGLDGWLSKGGFLPEAWNKGREGSK